MAPGAVVQEARMWLVLLLLLWPASATAQALTSSEETLTVSSSATGITAGLCGTSNAGGAYVMPITGGVYLSVHGSNVTPDSSDYRLLAGHVAYVRPANRVRLIQISATSSVKIQCTE